MVVNFILAFTVIFLERKDATATWAWLMVLFFIPILGFALYLIFGKTISKRKIFTWDTKSKLGVKRSVQAQMRAIEEDEFDFKHEHLMTYKDLFYLHLKNNDAIFTQGNKVDIYTDGEEKFNDLINDIDQATDHVHLLYYIIRHDELGKRIAEVLIKKAKEGVEVQIGRASCGKECRWRRGERERKEKET